MVNVLWLLSLAFSGRPRPPSLFVSIEGRRPHSTLNDIVVTRIAGRGRFLKGVFVSRQPLPPTLGPGGGATLLRPDPGRPRLAVETRSADGDAVQVDVWSVVPLRKTASIRFKGPGRAGWLPGTGLLAIVDRDKGRFRTRLFRPDGNVAATVPGGVGALADPAAGRSYVAEWAAPAARFDGANPWFLGALALGMRDGSIRFRVVRGGVLAGYASVAVVKDRIVGRGGTLGNLAYLLSPLSEATGYGRTWGIPRSTISEELGPDGIETIGEQFGYPTAKATLMRQDADDTDAIVSVDPRGRGAMTFSGRAVASLHRPGKGEGWTAAWVGAATRREWFLVGKGMSRGVFLWTD